MSQDLPVTTRETETEEGTEKQSLNTILLLRLMEKKQKQTLQNRFGLENPS